MISFRCAACGVTVKADDKYAGRAASCPKCRERVQVPAPEVDSSATALGTPTHGTEPQPYEFKGDRLGMRLQDFKAKHARTIQGHNECAPWCSDSRPGEEIRGLLSQPYFAEAGLVNCRLDFPFESLHERPTPTIAGVETDILLYKFVDEQLFAISAYFSNDGFDEVAEALVAKYGEPPGKDDANNCAWSNEVSTIVLEKGTQKNDPSSVYFVHNGLADIAEQRHPGPAVDDL